MSRRYRVLLPLTVHTPDGAYVQGEEFEHELSEEDELTNLNSGLIEVVPSVYRVVGASVVHDTPPGQTFERALKIGEEALLVAGGHIERVVDEPAEPAPQKASRSRAAKSNPSQPQE